MFEAVIINITSVNDFSMWYFILLMIKEDIPYFESTYLLQFMVQTLNETAIYLINILTQHKMTPNTFYKWLNIPLKINVPCMEIMKTCCFEVNLKLESLSNCLTDVNNFDLNLLLQLQNW